MSRSLRAGLTNGPGGAGGKARCIEHDNVVKLSIIVIQNFKLSIIVIHFFFLNVQKQISIRRHPILGGRLVASRALHPAVQPAPSGKENCREYCHLK